MKLKCREIKMTNNKRGKRPIVHTYLCINDSVIYH